MCGVCLGYYELVSPVVTLSVTDGEDACPFDPITLRCIVKKHTTQQLSFLSWRCTEDSSENFVFCNPILDFSCEFGTVSNISGFCECSNTIIVSEATFTPTSTTTRTLICGNGRQQQMIPLSTKGNSYSLWFSLLLMFFFHSFTDSYCEL